MALQAAALDSLTNGPNRGIRSMSALSNNRGAMTTRTPLAPVVQPVSMCDKNCEALTGLSPRAWRETLDKLKVPTIRIGRRRHCTVAAWIAALEAAAHPAAVARPWTEEDTLEAIREGAVRQQAFEDAAMAKHLRGEPLRFREAQAVARVQKRGGAR